jgi:hypothetical protein
MDVDGPFSGVGVSTMKTVNGEGVGGGVCVVVGARVAVLTGGSVGAVYAVASAPQDRASAQYEGDNSKQIEIVFTHAKSMAERRGWVKSKYSINGILG